MSAVVSPVHITGPLALYVTSFSVEMEAKGYRLSTVRQHLQLLGHVSRWLEAQNLDAADLTSARVEGFLKARRDEGYARLLTDIGIAPLLEHLRASGASPMAVVVHSSPSDDLLAVFRSYLLEERGVAATTAHDYARVARTFLRAHASGTDDVGLDGLTLQQVLGFLTDQCNRNVPNPIVTGLRAFLRFCFLQKLTTCDLARAIPMVANIRQSSLRKGLDPDHVRRLLESCDQNTTQGARNLAILTVLVRLGLRAGEVAALELRDIDWRRGEIMVRGKGPRLDRLPLPVDVGDAIAFWLAHGRPDCALPNVFLRMLAPLHCLTSLGVAGVVSAACRRAQIPEVGAHQLRHTAAREMLHAGSNLAEIGQVLRHRDLMTTAIYAKTSFRTLVNVSQPWPSAS